MSEQYPDNHQADIEASEEQAVAHQFRFLWFTGQLPATFHALRHRNFRYFWSGQMISLIGTWMQTVAQGWLVTELVRPASGDSSLYLGLINAAGSMPMLLFSLLAGVIADHRDKRHILLLTQTGAMVLAFALGLLTGFHRITLWSLGLLAVLLGMVNAFDMPTRQAFVKDMVGREDLLNAIALNSSIFNAARIVGPSIAGALIAIPGIGLAGAFYINAISYIAVIIGIYLIVPPKQPRLVTHAGLWQPLREGFTYVAGHATIRLLMVMMAIYSVFGFSIMVLIPAIAREVLHQNALGYGLLVSAMGAGAFIGAILLATYGSRIPKGRFLLYGGSSFALSLVILSQLHYFAAHLVFLALIGGGLVVSSSSINSLIQEIVPDHLRGRVVSMWTFIFAGFTPIGALYAGTVAHVFTPLAVLLVSGIVCLAMIVFLRIRTPWIWEIE